MNKDRNAKIWFKMRQISWMRVLVRSMEVMGRRLCRTGGHLPSRKRNVTPTLYMLMLVLIAFNLGAHHKQVADPRCSLDYCVMDSPPVKFNGHSLQMISSCSNELLKAMDPSSPASVNWWCHPAAGIANERTNTGKQSRINCCLELGGSLHLSLSGSCMSASVFLNSHPT